MIYQLLETQKPIRVRHKVGDKSSYLLPRLLTGAANEIVIDVSDPILPSDQPVVACEFAKKRKFADCKSKK